MVPADNVFLSSDLATDGVCRRHVFVGFILGVDTGLGSFYREGEGVEDDDGVAVDFALDIVRLGLQFLVGRVCKTYEHEAHDFDVAA